MHYSITINTHTELPATIWLYIPLFLSSKWDLGKLGEVLGVLFFNLYSIANRMYGRKIVRAGNMMSQRVEYCKQMSY